MTGDPVRRGIACAGNWILDIVHDIPRWPDKSDLVQISRQTSGLGGGPANVSIGLKAMGAPYPVIPVGLIGAGARGDEVMELCREAGLPLDRMSRTAEAATAQTHVMNVPGDSRTFFYHAGANDLLDIGNVDVPGLAASGVRIFYLGYLNLLATLNRTGPGGRIRAAELLSEVRALGMMTCVDLVSIQSETFRQTVMGTLPEIDVLFLNELEAARATGQPIRDGGDTDGMVAAAAILKEGGVRRAVALHSSEQVIWLDAGGPELFHAPPLPSDEIASHLGAGDAFAAGVLHGLHEDWSTEQSVELGFRAARACLRGLTATDGLWQMKGTFLAAAV